MGRMRRIDRDEILDAAERVVMRLGPKGMSIDAVAQEAGVSKSSVVYDHKSKAALLEALIDRGLALEKKRIDEAVEECRDTPHPELFGRLAAAERSMDDADKAVCTAICASMESDERLHRQMREWTENDLKAMATGAKPQAARLAYLALNGFFSTEVFGFYQWSAEERQTILAQIRTLYACFPDDAE